MTLSSFLTGASVCFILGGAALTYSNRGTVETPPLASPISKPLSASLTDITSVVTSQPQPQPLDAPQTQASQDLPILRAVIAAYQKGDLSGGDAVARSLTDPAAKALAEWIAIRTASRQVGYPRIAKFLTDNPSWPAAATVRRRAEEALYLEKIDQETVRAFFATRNPETEEGKIALAQVLFDAGDRNGAAALIRDAFRNDPLSDALEDDMVKKFGSTLAPADFKFRADRLLYEEDFAEGLKAAARAGPDVLALAKARTAIGKKAGNAQALLAAVPASMHQDPAYLFAKVKMFRRGGKAGDAAALLSKAPRDSIALVSPDEWWTERRLIARNLLDKGDLQTAYAVAAGAVGLGEQASMDQEFHAGWIALRFLKDAKTAAKHFAALSKIAMRPISISRGAYWQGRAAEAMGDHEISKRFYEAAALHATTYYGQIARSQLGFNDLKLRAASEISQEVATTFKNLVATQAIVMLYDLGERDFARILVSEFAANLQNPEHLVMLGDLAVTNNDPRTALGVGKSAVQRGLPLDRVAFPTNGIPTYQSVSNVEQAVVYSIARQESEFNHQVVSHAGARGLMQVMPATARATAKAANLPFDAERLTTDPAYNAQIGSAHLGELIAKYSGSYVMTFAAYNAGGAKVSDWVAAYGDPRNPKVDPIDWVERIPFTETRNYVQRVMENVQVYRASLGGKMVLLIDKDLRRGSP